MEKNWKLSPSELTFLWDECPRCFYLKVVHKISRPSTPMPKIFIRIDQLMKGYFQGKSTSEVNPELPEGTVTLGERWVESEAVYIPGHDPTVYFRGKFDSLVEFADGSFGVIDFKTSEPKEEYVEFYRRQLHAYAYALEHAAPGALSLKPISAMGLLFVDPVVMHKHETGKLGYFGEVTWRACPKDDYWFLNFIDQVVTVLEQPTPPDSGEKCGWCKYRVGAREHGL